MIVLVAYDIPANRRRARVAKLLTSFGERVQYSVFECHLTPARYLELRECLVRLVQPRLDRVSFYPLCQACFARAETIGPAYAETIEC
ncbi:MAG: CRISPR-associated endonuclease Cas2 [Bryobacterales bacterium]|nr:CRISPR-associated endonuclease Cas2 [Bryobacterales bacterium]